MQPVARPDFHRSANRYPSHDSATLAFIREATSQNHPGGMYSYTLRPLVDLDDELPNAMHDFHPAVANWFARAFPCATGAQQLAWPAIQSGRHALIAAPTGSGKTLAAFLAALDDLVRRGQE